MRATTRQHREIRTYLDDVLASARRQVLIEATIVEIELSDRYQAGVDWSRLAGNAGASVEQSLLAGNLAAAPFFRLGFRSRDLSLTVRLLKEFGNVQVLSSPKLVVLNNQTAVLKAIRNIVYFEVDVRTASGTEDNPATARIDTDARTAPEGIMLAVTPHVSRDGEIILNVRPTITRVNRFVNDPQPDLANAKVTNPVPELLVREMESILRLDSGQVAVLGGLMQDNHEIDTDGVPVLSELDGIGGLFRFRKDNFVKTELVIFIRPRVIRTPSVGADFQEFRHYLPGSDDAPPPIPSAGRLRRPACLRAGGRCAVPAGGPGGRAARTGVRLSRRRSVGTTGSAAGPGGTAGAAGTIQSAPPAPRALLPVVPRMRVPDRSTVPVSRSGSAARRSDRGGARTGLRGVPRGRRRFGRGGVPERARSRTPQPRRPPRPRGGRGAGGAMGGGSRPLCRGPRVPPRRQRRTGRPHRHRGAGSGAPGEPPEDAAVTRAAGRVPDFGLGNAYAAQSRWSEARRSYSEASRLDAGNADYTYNLAVSLDRLSQPDSAVALYREALELARRRPARFDATAVLARIRDVGSP